MKKVIELQGVQLKLGKREILTDINLRVSTEDRMVVMGPSGAGKSSLLRVMAGLVRPTSGEVTIDGQPVKDVVPSKRNIALLSQDYALYPQLTVRKNLQVALDCRLKQSAESCERVERVAIQFEITDILERMPSQISGGQAQRAALAKAVVRHPSLLLLDEPLSQIDFRLREQLIRLVLSASNELGIGLCWVAHDPWEAFRIANRIAVMNNGRVTQCGTPEELYRSPRNRLVADTLSPLPINWIALGSPEFADFTRSSPPDATIAGVRPESWEMVCENDWWLDSKSNSARLTVAPTIVETCFYGRQRLAWGILGGHRLLLLDNNGKLQVGDTAKLSVRIEEIIWMDH